MRGRPKEYRKREVFTTSADSDILERFRKICERERIPMNEPLQEFMKDYVQKNEEQNNPQTRIDIYDPPIPKITAPIENKRNWIKKMKGNKIFQELVFGIDEYNQCIKEAGFR